MLDTNIAFSQVREDPEIDLKVLESIKKKNKRVLMIGSGGCSILTMLLSKDLDLIDVIDANPAQIELIKLKIAALKNLSTNEYLDFIDGKGQTLNLLNKVKDDDYFNDDFWSIEDNFNQILYGVNQIGVFEQLFKELRDEFSENPMIRLNSVEWDNAFDKVFNRQHLIDAFGEDAVKYSMSQEFSVHFSRVMKNAIEKYKKDNNYFLDQIFKGFYENDFPIYLNEINKSIILDNIHKIRFINKPFHEYIKETDNEYDFIHTSNITDWLPLHILADLYSDIKNKLSDKGQVISRRLNGDHCLESIMKTSFYTKTFVEHLDVLNYETRFKYRDLIHLKSDDKSFFYNEVVVGEKD